MGEPGERDGEWDVDTGCAREAPLEDLMRLAWEARSKERPRILSAVYPTRTLAASVTGKECALKCAHCSGHYLRHMVDARDLDGLREAIARRKPRSILLSGGCDAAGGVPLAARLKDVGELIAEEAASGRKLAVNAHPGIVPPEAARAISDASTVVSFDFVLDDDTIEEAFRGAWTGRDYVETFRNLRKGKARVVPHILVGLKKGRAAGEYRAVDFLLREGIDRIIFIVFIPTPGTPWAAVPPPPVTEVARIMAWTRISAPGLDISLGCMRPAGKYRRELDLVALRCGADRIVLPHPDSLREAAARGLRVEKKEECCAFD